MALRVMIVDDSLLVRGAVGEMLSKVPGVEICARSPNGLDALDQMQRVRPDLIILDIEMPVMDGLTVLREMTRLGLRIPVLVLSVLTQHGARTAFQALDLGAYDFIPKPSATAGLRISDIEEILVSRVTEFIGDTGKKTPIGTNLSDQRVGAPFKILIIGSSTGGPQILAQIFKDLPENFPTPILIVQHMPPVFTAAFAGRLDQLSRIRVFEATHGQDVISGCAYLAPGNMHMTITENRKIELSDAPPVSAHRPSIDVGFYSALKVFGSATGAAMLTGMGKDGVDSISAIKRAGGFTVAQDEESSTVFGMNRRAIEAGAIDMVVKPQDMADVLLKHAARPD